MALAESAIDAARLGGEPLGAALKRPGFGADDLRRAIDGAWTRGVLETVLAGRQYAGYIDRQRAEARRQASMEERRVPGWLDVSRVPGLRTEARGAIERFRPATFGQASRLEGVTPADLTVLLVAMKRGPAGGAGRGEGR